MSSIEEHFPPQIRELEPYVGAFDAFQMNADGCKVLFATYPSGTSIPPHTHETENVGVITKGCLKLTVEGVQRSYQMGEWYHVGANVEHAADFDEDSAEIEFWFSV